MVVQDDKIYHEKWLSESSNFAILFIVKLWYLGIFIEPLQLLEFTIAYFIYKWDHFDFSVMPNILPIPHGDYKTCNSTKTYIFW